MFEDRRYDIVVAGGGIAGVAAAVSAARTGAKTLLVERYGFLGGLATAGLVSPFMTWRTSTGETLISGVFNEMLQRLDAADGLLLSSFDPEAFMFISQEMVLESGAEILLHTWIEEAVVESGKVTGIRVINKSGASTIYADRIIDCTGDADIAASAGVEFEIGDSNGRPQAMTLMLDVAGVDLVKVMAYVKDHPDQMRFPKLPTDADPIALADDIISVAGYYDQVALAKSNGDYPLPGDLIFFIGRPRRGDVVFNTTHIGSVVGTNADDLTQAEIDGRRQAHALVKFVRKYIPGFENAYLARTATEVGVRETRRIRGEYTFSARDVAGAAKFDDSIARLAYPVDVHSGKGEGYTREEENLPEGPAAPPAGDWYEVPYRCLVPVGVQNLLVAGRCVSATQSGQGAIRIMPCCAAMGQAAGAAAALTIKSGVTPSKVDISALLESLRGQGALV